LYSPEKQHFHQPLCHKKCADMGKCCMLPSCYMFATGRDNHNPLFWHSAGAKPFALLEKKWEKLLVLCRTCDDYGVGKCHCARVLVLLPCITWRGSWKLVWNMTMVLFNNQAAHRPRWTGLLMKHKRWQLLHAHRRYWSVVLIWHIYNYIKVSCSWALEPVYFKANNKKQTKELCSIMNILTVNLLFLQHYIYFVDNIVARLFL